MKYQSEADHLLNLNFTHLTNKTRSFGEDDLPALYCNVRVYPDFLALSGEPGLFHATNHTCVCFYEHDEEMDGIHGLYPAIYYNDVKLLEYYKRRFEGVKYCITPDFSECGDIHQIENKHRVFRSRLIGLWFIHEIGSVAIPNIMFPHISKLQYCLTGLDDCSVVAFSTKGYVRNKEERAVLQQAVEETTRSLNLKAIIVYDTCGDNSTVDEIFAYPREKGVEIITPINTLKHCNMRKKGGMLQ